MNAARFMVSPREGEGLAGEVPAFAPWFHNIRLPDGTRTAPEHPLGDFPAFKWEQIAPHLPEDLSGWTALDVGCNSGFYGIQLALRGAMVTGIEHDRHFLRQARWLAEVFGVGERIEFHEMEVYQVGRLRREFDLILFMGVFYHLRYPLLALDLLAPMTRRWMVFQTLTVPGDEVVVPPDDLEMERRERFNEPGWPRMAFIENSLAGDPTNWWAANHAGVEAMLRSAGLEVAARPGHEIYLCRPSSTADPEALARNRAERLAAVGQP
jgi:tRNA (mo5U34)-methyltransferase